MGFVFFLYFCGHKNVVAVNQGLFDGICGAFRLDGLHYSLLCATNC